MACLVFRFEGHFQKTNPCPKGVILKPGVYFGKGCILQHGCVNCDAIIYKFTLKEMITSTTSGGIGRPLVFLGQPYDTYMCLDDFGPYYLPSNEM